MQNDITIHINKGCYIFFIYNIENKTWEEVAPRKHKCHGFTLASHGKYVYAFGSFTYSPDYTPQWTSLDVIERYDTEKNVWEIVGRIPDAF